MIVILDQGGWTCLFRISQNVFSSNIELSIIFGKWYWNFFKRTISYFIEDTDILQKTKRRVCFEMNQGQAPRWPQTFIASIGCLAVFFSHLTKFWPRIYYHSNCLARARGNPIICADITRNDHYQLLWPLSFG